MSIITNLLGGFVIISIFSILGIYALIGIECVHSNRCIGANKYADKVSKLKCYKCNHTCFVP